MYTYGFFAGLSGDDFIMRYGNNGRYNDCVLVCENTEVFLKRTFGRIGLAYDYIPAIEWMKDIESLKEKICSFIDRGIPVLKKGEGVKGTNYNFLFAYDENGELFSITCGDPSSAKTYKLHEMECSFIFIDSLPVINDIAAVYRESILQIPVIMQSRTETGVAFGAQAYRN